MALTSIGWRGSVGESEIAELLSLAGVRTSVKSESDWKPTAVAGDRKVAIAAGIGYAAFIRTVSDSSTVLSFDAPLAGRWYLIVNRRTWSNRSSEFIALEGPTTSSAKPLAPPLVLPADFADDPGVMFDQEICWAWINATTTVVSIWDIREPPLSVRLSASHGFMSDGPHTAVYTLPDYVKDSGGASYTPPYLPVLVPSLSTPRATSLFTPKNGGMTLRKPGIYSAELRFALEYPTVDRSFAQINVDDFGYRTSIAVGETDGTVSVATAVTVKDDAGLGIAYYITWAASRRIIQSQRLAITYHGPQGS